MLRLPTEMDVHRECKLIKTPDYNQNHHEVSSICMGISSE